MDFAGGLIILNEVGGIGSNLMEPLTIESANSILVGNKATHNEILENYLNPHNEVLTELHQRFSLGQSTLKGEFLPNFTTETFFYIKASYFHDISF